MLWLLRAPAAAQEQLIPLLPSTRDRALPALAGELGSQASGRGGSHHLADPHTEEARFGPAGWRGSIRWKTGDPTRTCLAC